MNVFVVSRNVTAEFDKYGAKIKSATTSARSFAITKPIRRVKDQASYAKNDRQQLMFEENLLNFIVLDSMPFQFQ